MNTPIKPAWRKHNSEPYPPEIGWKIVRRAEAGETFRDIAASMGVSARRISKTIVVLVGRTRQLQILRTLNAIKKDQPTQAEIASAAIDEASFGEIQKSKADRLGERVCECVDCRGRVESMPADGRCPKCTVGVFETYRLTTHRPPEPEPCFIEEGQQ